MLLSALSARSFFATADRDRPFSAALAATGTSAKEAERKAMTSVVRATASLIEVAAEANGMERFIVPDPHRHFRISREVNAVL
jgi:hypothetical protein